MTTLDPIRGSEQAGTRPVLIVQADAVSAILRTVLVVPFTSNVKWARFPFCFEVASGDGGLTTDSVALCHQTRVLDKSRLMRRVGRVSDESLLKVEQALRVAAALRRARSERQPSPCPPAPKGTLRHAIPRARDQLLCG